MLLSPQAALLSGMGAAALPHACGDFAQGQLLEALNLPALPMVGTCLPVFDISNSSIPY